MQAGLVMARHLSKSSVMTQNLIGISVAALVCGQLEQLIQATDAPNLYFSYQALPRPLVDLTEQMKFEPEYLRKKIRILMNRVDCFPFSLFLEIIKTKQLSCCK